MVPPSTRPPPPPRPGLPVACPDWWAPPLGLVIHVEGLLQLAGDPLEEADLLQQVVLHLALEVAHARAVEVLDLGQRGAGDDVAALADATVRGPVLALLHLGKSP